MSADPRMREAFRCVPLQETYTRATCAERYRASQVAGSTHPLASRKCTNCGIGKTHARGGVPTHAAPALPGSAVVEAALPEPDREPRPGPLPGTPRPAARGNDAPPLTDYPARARCVDATCGEVIGCQRTGRLASCPKCGGDVARTPHPVAAPRADAPARAAKAAPARASRPAIPPPPAVPKREPMPAPTPPAVTRSLCALPQCLKASEPGKLFCSQACERDATGRPLAPLPSLERTSIANALGVVLSADERAAIDRAAASSGFNTGEWARAVLLGAAAITGGRA